MDSEKLQPRWFGPYAVKAWHNSCDVEIARGGGETRFASAFARAPGFSHLEGQAIQGKIKEG
eukprot:COSAG06_NODE_71242_length_186_cov_40.367816_1_plen_61_part_11